MKVSDEQKKYIEDQYTNFRKLGMPKQAARKRLSDATGLGMTTIWDHTYQLDHETRINDNKKLSGGWPKTYIITGWDLKVSTDEKFVACLEQMAKLYDADLLLVPCQQTDVKFLPQLLRDKFYVVGEEVQLNSNLVIRPIEVNALAQSPLAGHIGAYPDTTSILPGLVKELQTEPSQHYVKQIMSTGSVGYLGATLDDYKSVDEEREFLRKWRTVSTRRNGKPTAIANHYVVPSALVVDVLDNKIFLTRFISSYRSGVVYDLNHKFTPEGYSESNPLGLVVGDVHAWQVDEDAFTATKEMIECFQPREVVIQDFFDGVSVNYHEVGSSIEFDKAPSIEDEAAASREVLEEICDLSQSVTYLQSNHDNFLMKYLDKSEALWRLNRNYKMACELQMYRATSGKHPIIKLLGLDQIKNLKFIREKDNHYIGRVLVKHGHEGVSGARAGFSSLARIYNYYVQGHTHKPAVFRNAACVGLNGKLDMEYVLGAQAQMHANVLIQPDNSQQLLGIIYGMWRI